MLDLHYSQGRARQKRKTAHHGPLRDFRAPSGHLT